MKRVHPLELPIRDLTRPISYNYRPTGFFELIEKTQSIYSCQHKTVVDLKSQLHAKWFTEQNREKGIKR